MPDPLTLLLDAIHVEARWQDERWKRGHFTGLDWYRRAYVPEQDSISGRNAFWVTVMEGKE